MTRTITVAVVDATAMHLPALGAAARRAVGVRVAARCRDDLFDAARIRAFCDEVRAADVLIVLPHGGRESIPGLDAMLEAATGKLVHIQATSMSADELALAKEASTAFGSDDYRRRYAYLRRGGPDNALSLLHFVARGCGVDAPEPAPPQALATEGLYHPDYRGADAVDDYLAWARARAGADAPVIGIWFYQSYWSNGDLAPYDALIAEIEAQGAIPLAVFHMRMGDKDLGNLPVPALVERYFKRRGRALIDVLLSPMSFSLARSGIDGEAVLAGLDVPVLQLIMTANPRAVWEETLQAVSPIDVSMSVAQPEFDGAVIGTVAATREIAGLDAVTGAHLVRREPVAERVRHLVSWAINWARLRRTPPAERKVAILFHHYPPRNDRLGCAFGLDSFASVKAILERMRAEGYTVARDYADGDALAFELLDRLTNDRRYLAPKEMARRAVGRVDTPTAVRWHAGRAARLRTEMEDKWGPPPGVTFCHEGELLIGGVVNGNVFIGMQPPRARMEEEDAPTELPDGKSIHDPFLPATHHYLAYYRWLRETFGAQAVMHIGKHGTLEWLPGKSVGLSDACYPDAAIADLPNLYPYIINNPGEGTQAKRRSYAVILDHMIPPQTNAGKSEPLEAIEDLLEKAYFASQEDPDKLGFLLDEIWDRVTAAHLDADLGLDRAAADADPHAFMQALHGYLNEIDATSINDGLHVFGAPPPGERFNETLVHLTRLPNGDNPSLWDAIARSRGLDGEDLRDHPGAYLPERGKTKGQLLSEVIADARAAFDALDAEGWNAAAIARLVDERFGRSALVKRALGFVAEVARPKLVQTTDELEHAARGLDGRFVPPGGSGAPTRGCVDILPTGRNFFSVDPFKIPTPEAWKVGAMQGDALVARYREDEGRWPEQIGMVLWASPTMRTRGDDVAQILYMIGVRPVWDAASGRVKGVEVIPLAERSFPRLDVTVRASGLLRDAFPNVMELIDKATRMVAALDEPPEMNLLARNVGVDLGELLKAGVPPDEARRRAALRVYSDKPGCYGAGVAALLESGRWESPDDLGDIYIHWGGYAYGEGVYGEARQEDFRRRMGRLDLTLKNQDTRESDIFSSDDFNAYHGGMNAAVHAAAGRHARSYSGDSHDPRKPRVRSTEEEGRFVFRTRVLNPKWIEGMKRHGYKGAGDLSRLVDICFQWDATSGILGDWQYAEMAKTYAFDPAMQDFFKAHNPYALQNIAERLLEAIARGMWENPGDDKDKLEALLLEAEGEIEDSLAGAPKGSAAE